MVEENDGKLSLTFSRPSIPLMFSSPPFHPPTLSLLPPGRGWVEGHIALRDLVDIYTETSFASTVVVAVFRLINFGLII